MRMRALLLLAVPCVTSLTLLAHQPATQLRRPGLPAGLATGPCAHRAHFTGHARIPRLGLAGPRMESEGEGKKKFILFQIIDDVLDYLTDMGGYTGFTEEELKMGADLDAVSSSETFMRPKQEDAQTKATTDVFVALLIVVPLIGLGAGAAIFGSTYFP